MKAWIEGATTSEMGGVATQLANVNSAEFADMLASSRDSNPNAKSNFGWLLFHQQDGKQVFWDKLVEADNNDAFTVAASIVSDAVCGKLGDHFSEVDTDAITNTIRTRLDTGKMSPDEANAWYWGCNGVQNSSFCSLCAQMGTVFGLTGVDYSGNSATT